MALISMVITVVFLIWLQGLIYRKRWKRNLEMKLSFSAVEAFEGDRLYLTEELTNAKLLPLPWVAAKFQISRNLYFIGQRNFKISDDYYQNDIFSINMYQKITRRLDFICGRRGYYQIKSMNLASSNIFITEKLVKQIPCNAALTVFPKRIPFEELDILFRQVYGEIVVQRFTNPDPFAFKGIREYQPQDDFRSINFKATAKTNQLMVNINSSTASQELVILLNLQPYSAWSREGVFEEGIRLAASAAEYFIRKGLAVGVYSNGLDAVTHNQIRLKPGSGDGHFYSILQNLGRIDLSQQTEPFSGQIEKLIHPETAYLLISSYDGERLQKAFERLRSMGTVARWILPALPEDEVQVEESQYIQRWEVKPYDTWADFYQKNTG